MFDVQYRDDANVLKVETDLDIESIGALESTLSLVESASARRVVVSLERCSFLDSSALNTFIRAKQRLGNRFAIVLPAQHPMRRIFDITKLGPHLSVFTDLEEACAGT